VAVDRARVMMIYADGPNGRGVGSGYRITTDLVLTAGHVVVDYGLTIGDAVEILPLDKDRWCSGTVAWLGGTTMDAAVIRADPSVMSDLPEAFRLQWGRLAVDEPVTAVAVGFPWAQERPDRIRDTEHMVGFIAPLTGSIARTLHVTVVSSAPQTPSDEESPWQGMSGAALMVGPYLVGILVVDPVKYGTDRLVAVPVSMVVESPGFVEAVGGRPELVPIGADWRLEYAAGKSIALTAPYRPLPLGFSAERAPLRMLYPEHRLVPFTDRGGLVPVLTDWCLSVSAGLQVKTLTGQGGAGKTRLAAELCVAVNGQGWDGGFVDWRRPGGTTKWELDRPTLLVIDDADLNIELVADLIQTCAYQHMAIRLVLVSRSRRSWWRQLVTSTNFLVDGLDHGDVGLANLPLEYDERVSLYQSTLTALHQSMPTIETRSGSGEAVPDLQSVAFADPLVVELAAMLTLLGDPIDQGQGSGSMRQRILRAALDREMDRWVSSQHQSAGGTHSAEVLRRACVVATLSSPVDEAAAGKLLGVVPDLVDASEETRLALAQWLSNLYEGDSYWNPVRPDPIADQLLADTGSLPRLALSLVDRAVATNDFPTVDRLLTEVIRASSSAGGHARDALSQMVNQRLSELFDLAQFNPAASTIQALTVALTQTAARSAAALSERLPDKSTRLLDFSAEIARQVVGSARSQVDPESHESTADLAGSLNTQAVRLGDLGRAEEALTAINEAVDIRRTLAEARQDSYLPDLAMSLNNQANRLGDLGRAEEALTAINEAVDIYRTLAEARPDSYLPGLAMSLNNQSRILDALGRPADAHAAANEASELGTR
jgi:tetratricopeptide (TPR) repeat protein